MSNSNSSAGNWTCLKCGNENYASRQFCNMRKCGARRDGSGSGENWICLMCGNENYPSRTVCNRQRCGASREIADAKYQQKPTSPVAGQTSSVPPPPNTAWPPYYYNPYAINPAILASVLTTMGIPPASIPGLANLANLTSLAAPGVAAANPYLATPVNPTPVTTGVAPAVTNPTWSYNYTPQPNNTYQTTDTHSKKRIHSDIGNGQVDDREGLTTY